MGVTGAGGGRGVSASRVKPYYTAASLLSPPCNSPPPSPVCERHEWAVDLIPEDDDGHVGVGAGSPALTSVDTGGDKPLATLVLASLTRGNLSKERELSQAAPRPPPDSPLHPPYLMSEV